MTTHRMRYTYTQRHTRCKTIDTHGIQAATPRSQLRSHLSNTITAPAHYVLAEEAVWSTEEHNNRDDDFGKIGANNGARQRHRSNLNNLKPRDDTTDCGGTDTHTNTQKHTFKCTSVSVGGRTRLVRFVNHTYEFPTHNTRILGSVSTLRTPILAEFGILPSYLSHSFRLSAASCVDRHHSGPERANFCKYAHFTQKQKVLEKKKKKK